MKPTDAARLVLLGVIWGSSFYLLKLAFRSYSALQVVGARLSIGAVILVALLYLRGERLPRDRDLWRLVAMMAIIGNVVPFFLITWGTERVPSSLAAILNSTTPLFTTLLATWALTQEQLNIRRGAGILTGFVGVSLIVGVETHGSVVGMVAVLAASISYAGGFVFARLKLAPEPGTGHAIPAAQLLIGAAVTVPVALFDGARYPPTPAVTPTLAVLGLGALGTAVAYLLYYRLVEELGATTASFVTFLIPVFGVVLGHFALDERLGWNTFAGGVLVIAGIALAETAGSGPEEPSLPYPARTGS